MFGSIIVLHVFVISLYWVYGLVDFTYFLKYLESLTCLCLGVIC